MRKVRPSVLLRHLAAFFGTCTDPQKIGPDPKLWTTLREAWFLEMLHHKSTLEEQITGMYRKFGKRVSEDELGRKRQQLKMEGRYRYDDRQEEWYVDEVNDMERWKREYEAKKGKKSS